jgi:hypothetical protein
MQEREFLASDRRQRLEAVRTQGEYLGSRQYGGHRVHLYRMDGYFCEVWMRLGLNQAEWIEVARNLDILSEYVPLDPGSLLR